ncbi:class II aldolase/adducin family protein [Phaeacidiphilus oryzae]|uniref:class II aldolase/adducin family protein n=1 Tax=Phaeacidiphilus oryzae TaxID=348818 RepID=UPI000566A16E|nr:class II aldolase/adducin family protein [Phaeacidiphilus oryzae]
MLLAREREELAAAGRRIAAGGLVVNAAGNLSARAGGLVAVTPTGAALGELRPEDCPVLDLGTGEPREGGYAPTSETPLHLAVYRAYPDIRAVAHAHSLAATALGCVRDDVPMLHYAMLTLGGGLRVAPYATYGTEELAKAAVAALDGRTAALLRNHGSIALGDDLEQAVQRLELTEWLCELYARARALGEPREIPPERRAEAAGKLSGYGRRKATEDR